MEIKKQRSPITFRLKPEQEKQIRDNAKKANLTLSEFIKNRILENFDDEQSAA
jgi:uncharacterized protein (DUF1778 family)